MTYEEENTKLLKTILNASFLKPWKNPEKFDDNVERRDLALELYVTSACNQKCEYCYLYKHGDDLYPKEIRDSKTILNNLRILINHLTEKQYNVHRFDIFSGEIMHTQFGIDILDEIYRGKQNGLLVDEIHIPTNCSFILNETATKRLQEAFDRLKSVGIDVRPSASLDGLLIEDESRPFITNEFSGRRDQAFYDKAFEFILHNNGGFHPMISAYSIEKWKDNLMWWVSQCNKFNISMPHSVMTLEVRNDEWPAHKIKAYTEFLMFYADWLFNSFCCGNKELFTKMLIGMECPEHITGYLNLFLSNDTQIATCSVSHQLTVRLGDLALCPCHRTSYPEYLYGKFIVEDGKIVDIEGNNPFVAAKILMMNQRVCHHGCDACWNKDFCIRQCFGAQLESGQEIFMPIESVCNLLKEKTATLYKIYNKYEVPTVAHNFLQNGEPVSGFDRDKILSFLSLFDRLEEYLNVYTRLQDEDSK